MAKQKLEVRLKADLEETKHKTGVEETGFKVELKETKLKAPYHYKIGTGLNGIKKLLNLEVGVKMMLANPVIQGILLDALPTFLTETDSDRIRSLEKMVDQMIEQQKQNNGVIPQKTIDTIKNGFNEIFSITVLYVGSECHKLGYIGVNEEYNAIKKTIKSKLIKIDRVKSPVTIKNMIKKWDEKKPNVVFMSCHGEKTGLYLEKDNGECEIYNNTDFMEFFRLRTSYTYCVILSACESFDLGENILLYCNNVICMTKKVPIETVKVFSKHFFDYLNKIKEHRNVLYMEAYDYAMEIVVAQKYEGTDDIKFLVSKTKK